MLLASVLQAAMLQQLWAVAAAIAVIAVLLLVARKARAQINGADAEARAARAADALLAEEAAEDRRRRCVDASGPRYLVVVDFECTCEDQEEPFLHEIIEFPAVLLDLHSRREVRHFHAFVRPTERPVLSEFCSRLTGIDQATVDKAEPLDRVLVKFGAWLDEFVGEDYSLAADCQSDLRHFLLAECRRKKIRVRDAWRRWVDLGRHLMVHFDLRRPGNLQMKLARVGLTFDGTPHRGLDDARNIGRLALALQARGVSLTVNDGVVRPRRPAVTKKERKARSREDEARRRRSSRPVVVDW